MEEATEGATRRTAQRKHDYQYRADKERSLTPKRVQNQDLQVDPVKQFMDVSQADLKIFKAKKTSPPPEPNLQDLNRQQLEAMLSNIK